MSVDRAMLVLAAQFGFDDLRLCSVPFRGHELWARDGLTRAIARVDLHAWTDLADAVERACRQLRAHLDAEKQRQREKKVADLTETHAYRNKAALYAGLCPEGIVFQDGDVTMSNNDGDEAKVDHDPYSGSREADIICNVQRRFNGLSMYFDEDDEYDNECDLDDCTKGWSVDELKEEVMDWFERRLDEEIAGIRAKVTGDDGQD